MKRMGSGGKLAILLLLLFLVIFSHVSTAEHKQGTSQRVITPPQRNAGDVVIDGSGREHVIIPDKSDNGMGNWKAGNNRVSVSTVAIFTLAMAAATGLGAIPFFFVELDAQWAGICNGMAAGVMLAASFDLIQEGQAHGSGSWVVLGILAGGIFIWLCKKVRLSNLFLYFVFKFGYLFDLFIFFGKGMFLIIKIMK